MDIGRLAAYANIGSFVLGCFFVYGYFHPIAAAVPLLGVQNSANIPALMWLFLSALVLAGMLNAAAFAVPRLKAFSQSHAEAQLLRGDRYRPLAPSNTFEMIEAKPEQPQTDTALKWQRKLRVILRNQTGRRVTAVAPDWMSSNGYIPFQSQHAFWSNLELPEDSSEEGYKNGRWKSGQPSLVLTPNAVFRAGVGLDACYSVDEITARLATQRVGLLIIPVTIDGREMEWRTRL